MIANIIESMHGYEIRGLEVIEDNVYVIEDIDADCWFEVKNTARGYIVQFQRPGDDEVCTYTYNGDYEVAPDVDDIMFFQTYEEAEEYANGGFDDEMDMLE